jgi:hypothetical protein
MKKFSWLEINNKKKLQKCTKSIFRSALCAVFEAGEDKDPLAELVLQGRHGY